MSSFDYIIVGAGSAGCIMANQLSEDPRNRVLLLEAGPPDTHPFIHMPRGTGKLNSDPRHMWFFATEPSDEIPAEIWVRGKTLGGSSSVNGMMYFRGQPQDYDHWEELGAEGWGWDEIGTAFDAIEDRDGSGAGPLKLSQATERTPLSEALIAAGEQMGLAREDGLAHPEREIVGYATHSIFKGRRMSAAKAFLDPARKRSNLTIITDVLVDRVIFDGGRAAGVAASVNGRQQVFEADGEVLICAGGLGSPQILERSGIGNPELLKRLGIEVVTASPGVGEHMLEHRLLMIRHHLLQPVSENLNLQGVRLVANVLRYALTRTGPMAAGYAPVGAFVRASDDSDLPDSEILFALVVAEANAKGEFVVNRSHSIQAFGYPLRSRSEGSIHITSSDPSAPPRIAPGYLSDPYDRKISVAMHRYIRRFLAQPALSSIVGPERADTASLKTDEEILNAFLAHGDAGAHACGTCRMGGFNDAVVDSRLNVRGVTGLRVIDGSIMPTMVSANTNGPIMASAWRAAKIIQEDRHGR